MRSKITVNSEGEQMLRIARGRAPPSRPYTRPQRFTGRPYLEDPDMRMAYATYMLCTASQSISHHDRLYALRRLPNPLRVLEFAGTGAGLAGIKLWAEKKASLFIFMQRTSQRLHSRKQVVWPFRSALTRPVRAASICEKSDSQMMTIQQPDLVLGMNVFNELPTSRKHWRRDQCPIIATRSLPLSSPLLPSRRSRLFSCATI